MVTGSCLCGEIAYEITAPLEDATHCHCSMCRKVHGALFATYATVPADGFRWVRGEERLAHYESSPRFLRAFCPTCGSVAPERDGDGRQMFLALGNLEGDPGVRPRAHIFVASKAPWYEITDDLPRFDAYPPDESLPVIERPAPPPAEPGTVRGGCLCGAVAFEYAVEPRVAMNCHCSRCRRARSAAHATNVFVEAAAIRWTRGEDRVVRYDLPGAARFGQSFCEVCGSPVPRVSAGAPVANVPAGALDDDPGVRPRAHIHVASKAPWFEITDDLPRHDADPPAG